MPVAKATPDSLLESCVNALLKTLERRDPTIARHAQRVAALSPALAEAVACWI